MFIKNRFSYITQSQIGRSWKEKKPQGDTPLASFSYIWTKKNTEKSFFIYFVYFIHFYRKRYTYVAKLKYTYSVCMWIIYPFRMLEIVMFQQTNFLFRNELGWVSWVSQAYFSVLCLISKFRVFKYNNDLIERN